MTMTIKLTLLGVILALAGVIQSDSIDAWAKMTAVPVLGAVILALMWFNARNHRETLACHREACNQIAGAVEGIREDNKQYLETQNEALREILRGTKQ